MLKGSYLKVCGYEEFLRLNYAKNDFEVSSSL